MEIVKLRKVIISKITNKMPKYLSTIYNLTNKSTKVNYSKRLFRGKHFIN